MPTLRRVALASRGSCGLTAAAALTGAASSYRRAMGRQPSPRSSQRRRSDCAQWPRPRLAHVEAEAMLVRDAGPRSAISPPCRARRSREGHATAFRTSASRHLIKGGLCLVSRAAAQLRRHRRCVQRAPDRVEDAARRSAPIGLRATSSRVPYRPRAEVHAPLGSASRSTRSRSTPGSRRCTSSRTADGALHYVSRTITDQQRQVRRATIAKQGDKKNARSASFHVTDNLPRGQC
jgi:hypothetical protein